MGIAAYLKDIGRGARGARALAREQAQDLLGQILDGRCTDLEVGAFCAAMRIKGETAQEMAGFLDAIHARMARLPAPVSPAAQPVIVLPSYNGARKRPVLTPLLAHLLARAGAPVLIHGMATEDARITSRDVLRAFDPESGLPAALTANAVSPGEVRFVPTPALSPGLARLLDARRAIGLRNPAHSLVKLMNPIAGPALLIASYTHPEYAASMAETLALTGQSALLLKGCEGEPVADPRRVPHMDFIHAGQIRRVQDIEALPADVNADARLPEAIDAETTARHLRAVLAGDVPVPRALAVQNERALTCWREMPGQTPTPVQTAQSA